MFGKLSEAFQLVLLSDHPRLTISKVSYPAFIRGQAADGHCPSAIGPRSANGPDSHFQ